MNVRPLKRRRLRNWWVRHYGPMIIRAECGHRTLVFGWLRYRDGCDPWKSCPACHRAESARSHRRMQGTDEEIQERLDTIYGDDR